MVTIAVCDDAESERSITVKYCKEYFEGKKEGYRVFEYASGERVLADDWADILLIDVKMKYVSGILVKDLLQILRTKTRIIFVSEDKEFMAEAFGKNVFAFLTKPLEYEMFCEKMDWVLEDIWESRNFIYCREFMDYESTYRKIYLRDILYVEAQGHKTLIYTGHGDFCMKSDKRISEWKGEFVKCGFVSCHRSYVVNLWHVVRIGNDVELSYGMHVPLAREKKNDFRRIYKQYKNSVKENMNCRYG